MDSFTFNAVDPFFTINPLGICVIFISDTFSLVIIVDLLSDEVPVVIASGATLLGVGVILAIFGLTVKLKLACTHSPTILIHNCFRKNLNVLFSPTEIASSSRMLWSRSV